MYDNFLGINLLSIPLNRQHFFTFIFTGIPQNYVPRETCFLLESITTDAPSRRGVSCNIPEDCLDAWPLLLMKAGTRWITDSRADPSVWVHFWSTDMGLPGLFQQSKDHKPDSKAFLKDCFSKVHFTDRANCLHVQKLDEEKGELTSFPFSTTSALFHTSTNSVTTYSHSRGTSLSKAPLQLLLGSST